MKGGQLKQGGIDHDWVASAREQLEFAMWGGAEEGPSPLLK